MDVFARIVLGYDDSPGARRALDVAIQLAQLHHAQLIAVAVQAHLPHYGATVGEVEEERVVEEQTCRRWLTTAHATADEHGITLRTEIRAGHPAQELVRAVQAHNADLLIIGHSGHSAIWGRFIGTTADKAAHHANCSVLIVR
ncbi:MAG: universal stress protein [Actinobacteria bacterium]|nr:universal stress protein [Actinomycetota bacterium]